MRRILMVMCLFGAMTACALSQSSGMEKYIIRVNKGAIAKDTLKGSPRRQVLTKELCIVYHSPGVKGRIIWGGLVAYDQVWVTGAHRATTLKIKAPAKINGQKIDPANYGLFTIPGKEEWTIVLNTRWDQHLTDDYKEAEDVIRFKVKPLRHKKTQRLTYDFTESSGGSVLSMMWDELMIQFEIEIL